MLFLPSSYKIHPFLSTRTSDQWLTTAPLITETSFSAGFFGISCHLLLVQNVFTKNIFSATKFELLSLFISLPKPR